MFGKRKINVVIAIMATALIGTISLQAYWIINAYDIQKEQFDNRVIDALQLTAVQMEDREAYAFWSQMLREERFPPDSQHVTFQGQEPGFNDSMLLLSIDTAEKPFDGASSISVSITEDSTALGENVSTDVQVDRGDGYFEVIVENRGGGKKEVIVSRRAIQERYQQFNDLVDRAFIDYMFPRFALEFRIDKVEMEEQLRQNFANVGIELDFEYAVSDAGFLTPLASDFYNPSAPKTYRTQLFPNDLFTNESTLMVQFPSQSMFIWQSIWGIALLSLIFTAIIIFAFARTVILFRGQKRISEVKSDFINNMTHEFKTPIATISLALDAMKNKTVLQDAEQLMRYSGIIREENKRMNKQVENLLQLSQLEKEDIELHFSETNLSTLVETAIDHMRLPIEKRGGYIHFSNELDRDTVNVDEVHITNAIINLLDNANKYSPNKPEISIQLKRENRGLSLVVSDRGIGMDNETQRHIFDKFYRVTCGNIHDVKGHGIGLSYVKKIMDLHGAQIDVKSKPGEGSTFVLNFIDHE
jgi:signal transduction histidine kinase